MALTIQEFHFTQVDTYLFIYFRHTYISLTTCLTDKPGSLISDQLTPIWTLNANTCKVYDPADDSIKDDCLTFPNGKGICKFKLGKSPLQAFIKIEHTECSKIFYS